MGFPDHLGQHGAPIVELGRELVDEASKVAKAGLDSHAVTKLGVNVWFTWDRDSACLTPHSSLNANHSSDDVVLY